MKFSVISLIQQCNFSNECRYVLGFTINVCISHKTILVIYKNTESYTGL